MDPKGFVAENQLEHLLEVTAVTMIAVLPVLLLVPLILWRYRYGNDKSRYAPEWDQSRVLDVVMWGVPMAIVVFAGVLLWRSTNLLDPFRPLQPATEETRVQVVGLDWKWLFIYPDENLATVGELAFPVDRPLALELTSDTVMQSFMIGALGGQIYAMPGMRSKLHLSAEEPGEFVGENMQYSGEGFHTQKFRARAMSQKDFAAWLDNARQVAIPLHAGSYARLSARGTKDDLRAEFPTAVTGTGTVAFRLEGESPFAAALARYRGAAPVLPGEQPGSPRYQPPAASGGQP